MLIVLAIYLLMPLIWRAVQGWLARRLVNSFEKQARRQFEDIFGRTDDKPDDAPHQARDQARAYQQQREMHRQQRHAYAIHYMRQFSEPAVFEELSVVTTTDYDKGSVRFDRTTIVFTSQVTDADWTDIH